MFWSKVQMAGQAHQTGSEVSNGTVKKSAEWNGKRVNRSRLGLISTRFMQPSHHDMLNKHLLGFQQFARYWYDDRDKMHPVFHRVFYLPIKQKWMLSVQWLFMWAILSISFAFLCPVQEEQRSMTQKQKLGENSLTSQGQFSSLNLFLMPFWESQEVMALNFLEI